MVGVGSCFIFGPPLALAPFSGRPSIRCHLRTHPSTYSEMFSVRVPVRKLVKQPALSHPLSHLHPSTSKFFFLISPTKHSLEQNRQLTIASPFAQTPHVLAPDISHLFVTASLVSTCRARTPTALLPRPPPPSSPPPSDDRPARPHARAASWRCSASRAHEVKTDWERKGCPHGSH